VPPVLWELPAEEAAKTHVAHFMKWAGERHDREFADHEELWKWSVDELETFWADVWDYFEVQASVPYEQVLASRAMPGARWFPGSELNYAQHIFRDRPSEDVAIVHASEDQPLRNVTWAELEAGTARVAAALRGFGIGRGDRVAAFMTNTPEAIMALFAVMSIGAVWTSCSPDLGAKSVIDRIEQVKPRLLFAVDGYRYRGRDFDRLDVVRQLQQDVDSIEHTILLTDGDGLPDATGLSSTVLWRDIVDGPAEPLKFEQVPFDHPLWVVYTSGTTGRPKAIVHGHGGVLLEHLKNAHLQVDLHPGDRAFWFTTTGWMVWNILVSYLLTGATILTYDGSPAHQGPDTLWKLAAETKLTYVGTSPTYIAGSMAAGLEPGRDHDLSSARALGSSGSPLPAAGFRWLYEHVKEDAWVSSTTGGTDVCCALAGGCPIRPVVAGEIQARGLGISLETWDAEGRAIVGEVGEMVITEPMPSMPLGFWNDPDGTRYREAYFEAYPGVWRQGDWTEITDRGSVIVHGRSDSMINRHGVRIGTSEIYGVVLDFDEIADALVVDVPNGEASSWMPLFVVLAGDAELDDDLTARIADRLRTDCSPRHVPNDVISVPEVPRTLTGKVLEVPVKRILGGEPLEAVVSRSATANPQALEFFVELARSRAGGSA
jgi:acetoacetyl-CoA synthetase